MATRPLPVICKVWYSLVMVMSIPAAREKMSAPVTKGDVPDPDLRWRYTR